MDGEDYSLQSFDREYLSLDFQKNLVRSLKILAEMEKKFNSGPLSEVKLDLNYLEDFFKTCSDIVKPIRKAWKILSMMALHSPSMNFEDLRKEQIMIQNIYLKLYDDKLVHRFATAKVVILKYWNKIMSDYEKIHEYSCELFRSQIIRVLDIVNQMNLLSIEYLQLLNSMKQYFLDSWFLNMRPSAMGSSLDKFCEQFNHVEISLESFIITSQELMKCAADVRLERIYNVEGRIPVKKLSLLDTVDLSAIDTSFIFHSPRTLTSPRANSSASLTGASTDLNNSPQEYFAFPKKQQQIDNLNSSRVRVQKQITMNWEECKKYLEGLISEEFVFISGVTEIIKENLQHVSLPFLTCGSVRMLMNPDFSSLQNGHLAENRKHYQQSLNNSKHAHNVSTLSACTSVDGKDQNEQDSFISKDIFRLDTERINSATSDDLFDYNSTLKQIEDMNISFLQMGEVFFPSLEEKNVESLTLFYVEYLNNRIFSMVHGESSPFNDPVATEREPLTIKKKDDPLCKPILHCVHENIRLAKRQSTKESLNHSHVAIMTPRRTSSGFHCNTAFFNLLFNSLKYLSIDNYISSGRDNEKPVVTVSEEEFPSIYRILFGFVPNSHKRSSDPSARQSLNDLRNSLGKSKTNLHQNNDRLIDWINENRFEIFTIFEMITNFTHFKTQELKRVKECKMDCVTLSSDLYVLLELLYHFVKVLQGATHVRSYGFQSHLDTSCVHTLTETNGLSTLKTLLNGMKRGVGMIIDCFFTSLRSDLDAKIEQLFQENDYNFGKYYSQFQKPTKSGNKRRIVPMKTEKKSLIEQCFETVLPFLTSVMQNDSFSEEVRNEFSEKCCRIVVNTYVCFIEKHHEENIASLSKKRASERIKTVSKLTISLLDQLAEDKFTIMKLLDKVTTMDATLRDSMLRNVNHLISVYQYSMERTIQVENTSKLKRNQIIPTGRTTEIK
ncbi:hypothetical protein C9374_007259 [Naegleria lovaniensis]|uniref:Uncharacterized protein n=1 Tax=Naegleria lovaniensis TaxID=51637 RepID=A0AA88KPZ7_NAELO|nr:uncharacterized protein C9374_007259 [Naegleria lovaniensis]KAG2393728.1 hypothetical protein C9374_007259 [Naegleria lovaniensis]